MYMHRWASWERARATCSSLSTASPRFPHFFILNVVDFRMFIIFLILIIMLFPGIRQCFFLDLISSSGFWQDILFFHHRALPPRTCLQLFLPSLTCTASALRFFANFYWMHCSNDVFYRCLWWITAYRRQGKRSWTTIDPQHQGSTRESKVIIAGPTPTTWK